MLVEPSLRELQMIAGRLDPLQSSLRHHVAQSQSIGLEEIALDQRLDARVLAGRVKLKPRCVSRIDDRVVAELDENQSGKYM